MKDYLYLSLKKIIAACKYTYNLLKVNIISLLIMAIILILTVNVVQGQALIIDIIEHQPEQVVVFIFQVFFLSLIVSHYPTYIEFQQESNSKRVKWLLNKPSFLGIGFVTFASKQENPDANNYCEAYFQKERKGYFKENFRKFLGLLFYSCIIYIFIETYYKQVVFFERITSGRAPLIISFALFSVNLLLFIALDLLRNSKALQKLVWPIFLVLFFLCVIASAFCLTIVDKNHWSGIAVFIICTTLYVFSWLYIWVTNYRIPITCRIFKNSIDSNKINLLFIQLIAITGIISLLVHIGANVYPDNISPLIVILAILHVIYGIINIILKHYIYYTNTRQHIKFPVIGLLFENALWLVPTVFVIWYTIAEKVGNDLHELKPKIFDKSKAMNWESYEKNFKNRFSRNDTLYLIAAYGGGLKANLWNQYVLDSLDKCGILDKTIAISGVSGGSLGNAMYAAIQHEFTDEAERMQRIDAIGKSNFLTSDIAYLFGHDFVGNMLGTWLLPGGNRSIRSLEHYQEIILKGKENKNKLLGMPFQEYWNEMNQGTSYYPVLLLNSSGNDLRRGVACSINMSDTVFLSCFNNADNILSLPEGKSLAYFEAMSTSNRFPILSPAAKINGKGHYVDGGYFENSGMSSLLDFYFFLKQKKMLENHFIKIIQISNSQGVNIHNLLNNATNKAIVKREIKETSEIGAMYDTKIQLDYTPFYYSELLNVLEKDSTNRLKVYRIDMPHFIEENDIAQIYNAKRVYLDSLTRSRIFEKDTLIRTIRAKYPTRYLEPPLSRLLGQQSLNYMKIMLKQKDVIPKDL